MHTARVWILGLVVVAIVGGVVLAADDYDPAIDPANFQDGDGNPLAIDNPFLPMEPGTTFVYEGEGEDGFERNEVAVTHDTKVILGVTCTVVHDRVWIDGELEEETYDWHAQDKDGNVWYFGEDSWTWDDEGNWVSEGSWEAGVDGALPGIVMLASPQVGVSYRQEYYEGEAEDMGKVLKVNDEASVEYGDFEDVLKTKEWSPLEHGSVEHKYYAEGVGLVLVVGLKEGKEEFELVDILQ